MKETLKGGFLKNRYLLINYKENKMVNKKIKIDYPYEVKTFIDEYLKTSPLSSCHVLIYHGFIKI